MDMKHIKWDFSLKAWVRVRWVDLGGRAVAKINFSEYAHVAYQIKADNAGSNMVANILPTDTPLTQGVGSKGQFLSFFVSYKREYVHKLLVNRLLKPAQEKVWLSELTVPQ